MVASTSRLIAVTIGVIMTASTTPAVEKLAAVRDAAEQRSSPGTRPTVSAIHWYTSRAGLANTASAQRP